MQNDWLRKMRFACKRGTLESELILQAFLEHPDALALSTQEQTLFESLLELDDTTLMNALINAQKDALSPQQKIMLQQIRRAYLPV